MKLNVIRANPAGNITLFVLDPVPAEDRGKIAEQLMAIERFEAEQVGYKCEPAPGTDGHMEMMGGEFCGNATRAYGMLMAREHGLSGKLHLTLEVSGADHPVGVDLDTAAGTSRAEMPLPLFARAKEVDGHLGTLVHLGGIAHFVVEDVAPSIEFFEKAEPMFADLEGLDAYGVIFVRKAVEEEKELTYMTPLVKVPAANSLVWEGSCGSGSLACAVTQSIGLRDGKYVNRYIQPAGVVEAGVVRKNAKVIEAWIGGPVSFDEPEEVEI